MSNLELMYQSEKSNNMVYSEIRNGEQFISFRPKLNYMHSCTYINNPLRDQVSLTYTAPVLYKNVKDILILGAGAGENIRQLIEINNDYNITAVDINSEVFDIAKKFFNISENLKLKLVCDDAYHYVKKTCEKYDFIIVDVYKSDCIPEQFVTQQFFENINKILKNNGFFVMNTNFTNRFEKLSKDNSYNTIKFIQQNIYKAGFLSIFYNDMLNMGIQYVFKEKISLDKLMLKFVKLFNEASNKHLKAALAAIVLNVLEVEDMNIQNEIKIDKIDTKRNYYSKKILNIIRYYKNNEEEMNKSVEIENVTLKYIYYQIKSEHSKEKDSDIWYDFLNIDISEYYYEMLDWINSKEYIDFNEIKKYISTPNYLDLKTIKIKDANEYQIFLWKYVYSLYLVKHDRGDEAVDIQKDIIDFMIKFNYL